MAGDFLRSSLIMLVAAVVGGVIGLCVLAYRGWRDRVNRPSPEALREMIDQARAHKRDGWDYSRRLAHLRALGLRRNVADGILGEAERIDGQGADPRH